MYIQIYDFNLFQIKYPMAVVVTSRRTGAVGGLERRRSPGHGTRDHLPPTIRDRMGITQCSTCRTTPVDTICWSIWISIWTTRKRIRLLDLPAMRLWLARPSIRRHRYMETRTLPIVTRVLWGFSFINSARIRAVSISPWWRWRKRRTSPLHCGGAPKPGQRLDESGICTA